MSKQFKFTKRAIEALPVHNPNSASTDAEYSDTEVPGLKCCVSKNGRKSFLFRYTFQSRKRSMALGAFGAIDVESARKKAQHARGLIADGIDPQAKPIEANVSLTFKEFFNKHYLPKAKAEKLSWEDDESKMLIHLDPVFGKMPLDTIKYMDIQKYFTSLTGKRLAHATANRHLALLSCFFNLAVRFGFISVNPCVGVKKYKEDNNRQRVLDKSELVRLLAVMDDSNVETMEKNRVAVNVLKLLLLTGTRREEALHAKWSDIKLADKTWLLPKTKSGKPRHVSLNDDAVNLLKSINRVPSCDFVFVNPETNQRYNNPVKTFNRLLQRAGLDGQDICIHSLRHTFASLGVSNGLTLYEVQKLLGHTSIGSTQRYAHLSQETLLNATNVVSAAMRQT